MRFVLQTLHRHDVFLALGRIKVHWQFNSLRLVDSEGQVGLLLQVLEAEALQILFGEGLGVEDAGAGGGLLLALLRCVLATKQKFRVSTVNGNPNEMNL